MTSKWGVSLFTSILVSGLVTFLATVALDQPGSRAPVAQAAAAAPGPQDDADKDSNDGGPPPWAHGRGQGSGHGNSKASKNKEWKQAWKKLTPAQKQAKMADLVRAHEEGMLKWADCVAAAGNHASKRAACVKPLPPGLAKKLP